MRCIALDRHACYACVVGYATAVQRTEVVGVWISSDVNPNYVISIFMSHDGCAVTVSRHQMLLTEQQDRLQGWIETFVGQSTRLTYAAMKVKARSHRPCDQVMTYVRPVEELNRRESHINCATSRGGRGQSHDQNQSQTGSRTCSTNLLLRSQIVNGRTQVLHSCTTVARPVEGETGSMIDRATLRLVLQLAVTAKDQFWRCIYTV